jgi:hypothetical protein
MKYAIKQISELPQALVGYSSSNIEQSRKSVDGSSVVLKLNRAAEEGEAVIGHSEMIALLETAEWNAGVPNDV